MKKALLFLILLVGFTNAFCQFSANLIGYPLTTTGWTYGGNASVVDSEIQLTPNATDQAGYVYYSTPVNLTNCAEYSVKFDYKVVGGGITNTADGIAFWYISNPPTGFVLGGGIGLPTHPNGLCLIFDTYDNNSTPDNPLITLRGWNGVEYGYTEGPAPVDTGQLTPNLTNQNYVVDGTWHHCEIDYNNGNISVYLNYSTTPNMTGTYPMNISGYFGFSASTGLVTSKQYVKDIQISAIEVSPTPTTTPVSYCMNQSATAVTASGTGPFHWYPNSTDTAAVDTLSAAPVPSTNAVGTQTFYVRAGTGLCISPADSILVTVKPIPPAPTITGDTAYCTGATFVPPVATGTGTIEWYLVRTGGASSTTFPAPASMAAPFRNEYYAAQLVNGCIGPRDSIRIINYTTPAPPRLTSGGTEYCQFATATPLVVSGTDVMWYTASTGGTGTATAPTVSTLTAGTTAHYVNQTDSGCTSARATINVTVHPKPAVPTINPPQSYCQFATPGRLSASLSGASTDQLLWYGTGAAGIALAPIPSTAVGPDTTLYYVTETSIYNCVSDSALDKIIIIKKPAPPIVSNTIHCQLDKAGGLNALIDSSANSKLNWYVNGFPVDSTPVPITDTAPGNYTWYVAQTINTCESDSLPVLVKLLYKPEFSIIASQSSVCRYDSIILKYHGPQLIAPSYAWTLPEGAYFANGSHVYDDSVTIKFDSVVVSNYVTLAATADSGRCTTDTSIRINVISQPSAQALTRADVCLGDTVSLALNTISNDPATYTWNIDGASLSSSAAVTLIRTNSNSGGPYSIAWVDSGRHIIETTSFTQEGCKSEPSYDTVNVHVLPSAQFTIISKNTGACIDDSVEFMATVADYNNLYQWSPSEFFDNVNTPSAWGKVAEAKTIITLTVTDPFGCTATSNLEVDPGSCCTVGMPNAFTPNGDTHDDYFRPLYNGYHHFHAFRIVNRWGQLVFNSENSNMQWDGNTNGVPQDMGVYYYYLKFDCGGKTIEQKGDVTLIR